MGESEGCPRPVLYKGDELDLMFRVRHEHAISKKLTIKFNDQTYRVLGRGNGCRLRGIERVGGIPRTEHKRTGTKGQGKP